MIIYNLSCYLAKQDRMEEAKELLGKAIELDPTFKEVALEDEDLAGLW